MAKGYSKDLRARAVALVEDGESRREAARVLGLGASTAIRWIERWECIYPWRRMRQYRAGVEGRAHQHGTSIVDLYSADCIINMSASELRQAQAKRAAIRVGRYTHAHQFKRARWKLKLLCTRLGWSSQFRVRWNMTRVRVSPVACQSRMDFASMQCAPFAILTI